MKFLDKYGWPVETIKGRPVVNFFRRLIHTRKIVKHWSPSKRLDVSNHCDGSPTADAEQQADGE